MEMAQTENYRTNTHRGTVMVISVEHVPRVSRKSEQRPETDSLTSDNSQNQRKLRVRVNRSLPRGKKSYLNSHYKSFSKINEALYRLTF